MPTASDEPHYLIIMQSLTQDHDLDLTNNYASEAYREFYPDELRERHVIQVGPWQYPIVTSDCLSSVRCPSRLVAARARRAHGTRRCRARGAVVSRMPRSAHRSQSALVGTALACLTHRSFVHDADLP